MNFPIGPFEKYAGNPILSPIGAGFEVKDVFNPTAVVWNGRIFLLYRAEDDSGVGKWNGTSRIGLAVSDDGYHFERFREPVLVPTEPYEQPGGCEDPRVTRIGDTFYLTYTAFDGQCAYLCLATSKTLTEWEKHGIVFPTWREGMDRVWSKSGAILDTPIHGRYVMYFGDTNIWMAESEDLIHWMPRYEPVMYPNADPDCFDSVLIEPGPAPWMTDEGILLVYNAARKLPGTRAGSSKLQYAVGQVLLDKENPHRVLKRTSTPFLEPNTRDEQSGQVDHVVFAEGMVSFHGTYFLYFGMADSKIGVATWQESGIS